MNLLLFLSDRCNMTCSYCFLSLNDGPAVALSLDDAKRAIDAHRARFPRGRVTLLGGEPTLHRETLLGAARHAAGGPITAVTNGTRLDAELLAALRETGAQVCVSLDGPAAVNDESRRLLSGGSAHDAVVARLSGPDLGGLRANLVAREKTVASLLSSVEHLRSLGFRQISCHLDVGEAWSERGLSALKTAAKGLRRYLDAAKGAVTLANQPALAPQPADHDYDDVVLGADGRYYPCDGLFARPYRELSAWAIGDARVGLDWKARERAHGRARAEIHSWIGAHAGCPREPYFQARVTGGDARAAVRRFHAADAVFTEALCLQPA